jgi:hypothetical protein
VDQSTVFNYVDQNNARTTYVDDSDTNVQEVSNVTMAFPESHHIENDNSTRISLTNNFETLDQDNSVINNVDARQIQYLTSEDPTYVFDNSSSVIMNFDAPERVGGNIVVGHA